MIGKGKQMGRFCSVSGKKAFAGCFQRDGSLAQKQHSVGAASAPAHPFGVFPQLPTHPEGELTHPYSFVQTRETNLKRIEIHGKKITAKLRPAIFIDISENNLSLL